MENKMYVVSASPHVHGGENISKLMVDVLLALIPAFLVSLYYFGIGAFVVTLTSVLGCVVTEYLIVKFLLKKHPTIRDGSAILTGLLLAFNLPSNLPLWIILIGAVVAIGIGKMSYGGLGNNVFNPALVGRVFLLVSFPVQMTSWPKPVVTRLQYFDAATGATPLGVLKEGLKEGKTISELLSGIPDTLNLFLGNQGGSIGEVAGIALLIGLIYMLIRKTITWHIPISILGMVAIFTAILYGVNPEKFADPGFHLFSGGLILGAVYMATDYVTSPMTKKGMIIYGVFIGIITVLIRTFGSYPEGVSFAILIMNAFVPLINRYVKPKRFGEVINNG